MASLTKKQRECLDVLTRTPHAGPGELAVLMDTTPEGAAATASSLVRRGLAERRTDLGDSGRLVRYRITPSGKAKLGQQRQPGTRSLGELLRF